MVVQGQGRIHANLKLNARPFDYEAVCLMLMHQKQQKVHWKTIVEVNTT